MRAECRRATRSVRGRLASTPSSAVQEPRVRRCASVTLPYALRAERQREHLPSWILLLGKCWPKLSTIFGRVRVRCECH